MTDPYKAMAGIVDDVYGSADIGGDPRPNEPYTELGMARRLIAVHGERLRYVPAWGRWLTWDGHRWADDTTGAAQRAAKQVARQLLRHAVDSDSPNRKSAMRFASHCESAAGVRSVLTLSGTEEGIALDPAELDADPNLFNCLNGTLDLRTGHLLEHDPKRHITKVAGADYRPDAPHSAFDAFLARIQPDPNMRRYLARLLGYTLGGAVTEHILPILWGNGANGKSVAVRTALAAVGDYGQTTDPGLLIDRGDVHPAGVADLFGVRLAVTHETDAGRYLAEGTVKRLTGGDTIKARRMRENFWSFEPSHTVIMVTNHKPLVRGRDEGIWRRLKLVPFTVEIPAAEQDTELPSRLESELAGVLAWLVNGYRDWLSTGLADPDAVTEATRGYRRESDDFARWIDDRCLTGPHFHASAADLWKAWSKWCDAERADPGTKTAFGLELAARGFAKEKKSGAVRWHGIALASGDEDEPEGSWS